MTRLPQPSPPFARWAERLEALCETARAELREQPPALLAARSGAEFDPQTGLLSLPFFTERYHLRFPDLTIRREDGQEPSSFIQSLLLSYLRTADGTPLADRWIGFRELPDGLFYHVAFQGYTGNRLARALGNDLTPFHRAAQALAGERLDLGDAAYAFPVLPRLPIAVVYWLGDEEFAPRASLLFDASAPHYLVTDGLAILGSQLVRRLLKAAV